MRPTGVYFVGGVEDEQRLAVGGLDAGEQAGIVFAVGQFDGGDHVIADQRWSFGIDDAASAVHVEVVGVDADGLQHGDEQGGFVLAVAVAVAIDVSGVVGLPAADALLDDEIADVFLDVVGDAAQLGVEVGSAGDEFLSLGGDLGRGIGAVLFQLLLPEADGAPLIVGALDGGVAPFDRHAGGQRSPCGSGVEVLRDRGRACP